jgi:hypothetical protein
VTADAFLTALAPSPTPDLIFVPHSCGGRRLPRPSAHTPEPHRAPVLVLCTHDLVIQLHLHECKHSILIKSALGGVPPQPDGSGGGELSKLCLAKPARTSCTQGFQQKAKHQQTLARLWRSVGRCVHHAQVISPLAERGWSKNI